MPDFKDPNVWTAVFTGLTVVVGALAIWFAERARKQASEPLLELETQQEGRGGTHRLRARLRNRGPATIRLVKVRIVGPESVSFLGWDGEGRDTYPRERRIDRRAGPAGSVVHVQAVMSENSRRYPAPNDVAEESLLLRVPRAFDGTVTIEATVVRGDRAAKPMKITSSIWITDVPASD